MSDDPLIAGAAAPVGQRWIHSAAVLDAGWVIVGAIALVASSFVALVDLPNADLRTGDEPLRFFVVGLPVIATVIAIVGAARGSVVIVAAATGVLAPAISLAGSLGVSLLLSEASAFADVGVSVSIGAALFGVALLIRWFVYHPLPLLGDQSRPVRVAGHMMLALGFASAVVLLVTTLVGDTSWSASSVAQTTMLATVASVVLAAGATRTIASAWLAFAACVAQVTAVFIVKIEQSSIPYDSDLVLRTGVAGLATLAVTAVAALIAAIRVGVDAEPTDVADGVESWRWQPDD